MHRGLATFSRNGHMCLDEKTCNFRREIEDAGARWHRFIPVISRFPQQAGVRFIESAGNYLHPRRRVKSAAPANPLTSEFDFCPTVISICYSSAAYNRKLSISPTRRRTAKPGVGRLQPARRESNPTGFNDTFPHQSTLAAPQVRCVVVGLQHWPLLAVPVFLNDLGTMPVAWPLSASKARIPRGNCVDGFQ